jgi:PPOX class probable F420-dependent enzyme
MMSKHLKKELTMAITIPQSLKKVLEDKAYGHVVTFNAKGKPELTMVWMDVEGDEILLNTAEGRRKPGNIRHDPHVIVSVQDRNNPQAYAVFHGKGRVTDAGADAHIDKLAKRFLGADKYPFRQPNEKRVIVRISVDRISGVGPNFQNWS